MNTNFYTRLSESAWEEEKTSIEEARAVEAKRVAALPKDPKAAIVKAWDLLNLKAAKTASDDLINDAVQSAALLSAVLHAKHPFDDCDDEAAAWAAYHLYDNLCLIAREVNKASELLRNVQLDSSGFIGDEYCALKSGEGQ